MMKGQIALVLTLCGGPFVLDSQRPSGRLEVVTSTLATPIANAADGTEPSIKRRARASGSIVHIGNMQQRIQLGASLDAGDPTRFRVLNFDDPFGNGAVADEVHDFTASFEIVEAEARKKNEFYLLGAIGGDDIVERWRKRPGGTPGGSSAYLMERTEIYRGPALGVDSYDVDNQGRFILMFHDQPRRLSKMSVPSGQVTTVYDTSQLPFLDDLIATELYPRLHDVHGIVWTLDAWSTASLMPVVVLFFDFDDDGSLDDWLLYDVDTYLEEYPAEDWLEDFVSQS